MRSASDEPIRGRLKYAVPFFRIEVKNIGSGNWIVDNLNSALSTWNDKLAEIWTLISTSPENFKGGGVWSVIVNINDGLKAVGYALLVLFFVMGVVKTMGSFAEVKLS